jgi:LysR family transcriptional regulator, transcriptional activator of nhaA
MKYWLNYHHLLYFRTIAREGSISAASIKLRLGQPTLSAQLRALEESLGVKLFERRNRKLHLTDAGRIALEYSDSIFKTGDELIEVLQDRLSPTRTHVQIGALDSVPKHVVLSLVQSALKQGKCTVSVLEGKHDELLRELLAHRIDLILSNGPSFGVEGAKLYSKRVARMPVVVAGARKFKSLKKNFPHSLGNQPMIVPTVHSKLRADLDHFFRTQKIPVDICVETQDTAVQKLLGLHGIGLVSAPRVALDEYLTSGELLEIGRIPGVHEEIHLTAASRRIENPISNKIFASFEIH